jgi:hypothetical protein
MIGQLPVDEQLDSFEELIRRNDILTEVLAQAASLELPGWYLTAGCLFQTVWNVVTGRPPADGIKDYDLFYFDAADLSWEAEDLVIQSAKKTFAELPAEVETGGSTARWATTKRSAGSCARTPTATSSSATASRP